MSADATIRRLRQDDANSFRAIRLEAVKANPEALGSTFELEDKLDVAWSEVVPMRGTTGRLS